MTFAVNQLAPFLLTDLLLPMLKASTPARIINISSNIERISSSSFGDIQSKQRYISIRAYAQAKLALLLFTYELAQRLEGTGVIVNAVTPGPVATNFGKNGKSVMNRVLPFLFHFARSAEEAAQTAVYLASSPQAEGVTGKAFYNSKELASSRNSYNLVLQKEAWQISEDLVKF